ncbi:hypothetical protein CYY_000542 [Polysphondylium violaceum]|uniref:Transmembrane protein n=1 Tax=Polysphondylium violaceum TaxID=133409 RepID=A0A8J4Q1C8_9MYCE|nr:hypothetical protein CYY_000542 [Polysphondylium violaceum]
MPSSEIQSKIKFFENIQKCNNANQVIKNVIPKKPSYVPAKINVTENGVSSINQMYVEIKKTNLTNDTLKMEKLEVINPKYDQVKKTTPDTLKDMKYVGYHGSDAYNDLLDPNVKLRPTIFKDKPQWDGFYSSPDPIVTTGYISSKEGGILDVYASKDTHVVNTNHTMDSIEANAVAKAVNRSPQLGGSDVVPSKNILTELKLTDSSTVAGYDRKQDRATIDHHNPETAPSVAPKTAPEFIANVATENKVNLQKAKSATVNGGNVVISGVGAYQSAKAFFEAMGKEDKARIALTSTGFAASAADTISTTAKVTSSTAKGIRNIMLKSEQLGTGVEKLTSLADKATKATNAVNKVALPLALGAGAIASGIDIHQAYKEPTAKNITKAVVTTTGTAVTTTSAGLCAFGKITTKAMGSTMGVVGVAMSAYSIYDALSDETKSSSEKAKQCTSAGLNMVGTALLFTPAAPLGVVCIVGSVVMDLFW